MWEVVVRVVGLQGYASALTSKGTAGEGDATNREFELDVGDALLLDNTCCRGCPLGLGGDQLVYRFVSCEPGARGVLWRAPPEILASVMMTRF